MAVLINFYLKRNNKYAVLVGLSLLWFSPYNVLSVVNDIA